MQTKKIIGIALCASLVSSMAAITAMKTETAFMKVPLRSKVLPMI